MSEPGSWKQVISGCASIRFISILLGNSWRERSECYLKFPPIQPSQLQFTLPLSFQPKKKDILSLSLNIQPHSLHFTSLLAPLFFALCAPIPEIRFIHQLQINGVNLSSQCSLKHSSSHLDSHTFDCHSAKRIMPNKPSPTLGWVGPLHRNQPRLFCLFKAEPLKLNFLLLPCHFPGFFLFFQVQKCHELVNVNAVAQNRPPSNTCFYLSSSSKKLF